MSEALGAACKGFQDTGPLEGIRETIARQDSPMAGSKSITLNPSELQSLADRLYSRGISEFSTHTTERSRDLRIASQALRVLLNEIDKVDAIAGDVAHQLRNLGVTVES
jgi:hypothetical protein